MYFSGRSPLPPAYRNGLGQIKPASTGETRETIRDHDNADSRSPAISNRPPRAPRAIGNQSDPPDVPRLHGSNPQPGQALLLRRRPLQGVSALALPDRLFATHGPEAIRPRPPDTVQNARSRRLDRGIGVRNNAVATPRRPRSVKNLARQACFEMNTIWTGNWARGRLRQIKRLERGHSRR